MTLKEIAKAAGVSITTVSRVLNKGDETAASKEIRDKIYEIAKEWDYKPNAAARELQQGSVRLSSPRSFNCIIARPPAEANDDPFYSTLIKSLTAEALKFNYQIRQILYAYDLRTSFFHTIPASHFDGTIILGRFNNEFMHYIRKHYKNVVYIGLNSLDSPFDEIICDGYKAAFQAVGYLISLGHKRIGFIGFKSLDEDRFRGYYDALKLNQLTFNPEITSHVIPSFKGGYEGLEKILKNTVNLTAVLCVNDLTATGTLSCAKEHGISVPESLSIISINNTESVQHTVPMLSTIHVPLEEMGKVAVKTLADRIDGGHKLPQKIYLPFYVVKRQSCAKI